MRIKEILVKFYADEFHKCKFKIDFVTNETSSLSPTVSVAQAVALIPQGAAFQLFLSLWLFSFVYTFSLFLFLITALYDIDHVTHLLPARSFQYIESDSS